MSFDIYFAVFCFSTHIRTQILSYPLFCVLPRSICRFCHIARSKRPNGCNFIIVQEFHFHVNGCRWRVNVAPKNGSLMTQNCARAISCQITIYAAFFSGQLKNFGSACVWFQSIYWVSWYCIRKLTHTHKQRLKLKHNHNVQIHLPNYEKNDWNHTPSSSSPTNVIFSKLVNELGWDGEKSWEKRSHHKYHADQRKTIQMFRYVSV